MNENLVKLFSEIYTIGHSNHKSDELIKLLNQYQIEILVDVRSNPYSRYSPQFNKELLRQIIEISGIKYLFLGNLIGGRPEDERFYDINGQVRYDQIEQTPHFQEGINRLLKEIQSYKIAILCGEEDPMHCHRRLLIGRVLSKHGIRILHIRGNGQIQAEEELASIEASVKGTKQMNLPFM
ncbi:MAG: DUF488 domain-containing protein [Thermodesulfobacteriota bacterium]